MELVEIIELQWLVIEQMSTHMGTITSQLASTIELAEKLYKQVHMLLTLSTVAFIMGVWVWSRRSSRY